MDDDGLYAALRRMWRDRDPVPENLADDVLVALATRTLADEYALLTLVEESTELVGVRGDDELRLLEFRDGELGVMLRISDLGDGRVRVDGWLTPGGLGHATLEQDATDAEAEVGAEGRFAFSDVPRGAAALRIVTDDGAALHTERFEL